MSAHPSTPDPVALTRQMGAAEDVETTMSFFRPNPVWDGSPLGLEVYEGRDAIRQSLEEWLEIYDDHEEQDEEIVDLGRGVVFSSTRLTARSRASDVSVSGSYGFVISWIDGKIARVSVYPSAGEARVAAERLAASLDA